MFNRTNMNEMLNMLVQVPVHPFGFATVPVDAISSVSLVSLVYGPKFCMRENLFTSGLQLDWLLLELHR